MLLVACGDTGVPDVTATIPMELILTAMQDISNSETQTASISTATVTAEKPPIVQTTPVPENTATPTADPTGNKSDGVYMVGLDMALGEWRSEDGGGQSCYWVRRKNDGIILGSYFGQQGTTMRIEEVDFEVQMEGCGEWVYVGP